MIYLEFYNTSSISIQASYIFRLTSRYSTVKTAKRQFVSNLELQETLSILQKKNEEETELIGELSSQCDQLEKDI